MLCGQFGSFCDVHYLEGKSDRLVLGWLIFNRLDVSFQSSIEHGLVMFVMALSLYDEVVKDLKVFWLYRVYIWLLRMLNHTYLPLNYLILQFSFEVKLSQTSQHGSYEVILFATDRNLWHGLYFIDLRGNSLDYCTDHILVLEPISEFPFWRNQKCSEIWHRNVFQVVCQFHHFALKSEQQGSGVKHSVIGPVTR